jgi:hypothetical protein
MIETYNANINTLFNELNYLTHRRAYAETISLLNVLSSALQEEAKFAAEVEAEMDADLDAELDGFKA